MKTENKHLIDDLLAMTEKSTSSVLNLKSLSLEALNFKSSSGQWSILQCLDHLNLYGNFYLVKIEEQILNQKISNDKLVFKSGILGNYFANMMRVKKDKVKKYKAMKSMTPESSKLTILAIEQFLKQQALLKALLLQCRNIDLNKPKVETSLSKLIKLKLGDTLRFLVYHIERHIIQAENIHSR